jgi:hypothetical protein
MDGALGASWFGGTVGAFLQAFLSVTKKVITTVTKLAVIRNMMV